MLMRKNPPKDERYDNKNVFDPNYLIISKFTDDELEIIKQDPAKYIREPDILKWMYIFTFAERLNKLDA